MPEPPPEWAQRLTQLAHNLWWTWHPEVADLFRAIDVKAWVASNHNPVALLRQWDPGWLADRLEALGGTDRFDFYYHRLLEYLTTEVTWCSGHAGPLRVAPVAYFSAEFGVHEALPLYSGGLGVLASDFLKSASDLGVPIIGIGLFYAHGYFRQRLDAAGWQIEDFGQTQVDDLPLVRAAAADGSELRVEVPCGADRIRAAVWLAHLGRARLLLLDTNVDGNPDQVRTLTAQLYGGDALTRLRQEAVLGIGGLRALAALGEQPTLLHLNEGHSAFAVLEQVRNRMAHDGESFDEAWRETAMRSVFTTHTPVEAGHDRFSPELMESQLGWLRSELGLDGRTFLGLGRVNPGDPGESFCMSVLALRGARHRNAVSSLHGYVARRMWRSLWPEQPEERVPIGHITNGVHVLTWLAPPMRRLYDTVLGGDWPLRQADAETWQAIATLDDSELWETHTLLRHLLVEFVRARTGIRGLAPGALTIGFARRFATYKRATLLFTDVERLARLVADSAHPVQFVFAGKAHPRDDGGKRLLQRIATLCRDPRFEGRLVFIEDYDINVARHLVHGVDVWLNTPLRPLEACGTSGQKVVLNGGLNASILDGWWAEAYDGGNGFAIGSGTVHRDPQEQWRRDAEALYDVLEQQVVPLFYARDTAGLPVQWIHRMKRSITTLGWRFNAARMVIDYVNGCYLSAAGAVSMQMGDQP